MSNYTHVQFISWELYTGPVGSPAMPAIGWYAGLSDGSPDRRTDALGQCWDIDARIAFTADAIAKAEARSDRSTTTLKVFMAPEFLYRGAGGAYLHDLIGGWVKGAPAELGLPAPYNGQWDGLFGGLGALIAKPAYNDWLFVFGTAVSASFPGARAGNGKYVLNPQAMGEVYNSTLIQRGGTANAAARYVSRKHYKSNIDFVNWNAAARNQHSDNRVAPLDPAGVLPLDALGVSEGGALFQITGLNDASGKAIDFGIEICLDHMVSANSAANGIARSGRIRGSGRYVKIQLVPSGGMHLVPDSIRLQPASGATPRSYAFNCDGLTNLRSDVRGSHTQLWNGSNGNATPPAGNQLVEASGSATVAATVVVPLPDIINTTHGAVAAATLWNSGVGAAGAGAVRLLARHDL